MVSTPDRLHRLYCALTRRFPIVVAGLLLTVQPAAAQTTPDGCTVPDSFTPLFNLLNTLAEIAFVAGLSIGLLGLLVAGTYMMLPGQDSNRKGKEIAKHVIFGTILLLSANMIMSFLTSQLGTALCS